MSLLIGIVAALATACNNSPGVESGGLRLTSLDGLVQVRHDGEWTTVEEATELARGDQVKVDKVGHATIDMPGNDSIELGELGSVSLQNLRKPKVLGGSVLAQTTDGLTLGTEGFDIVANEQTTLRVDLLLSDRIGVYEGEVTVPRSGWSDPVQEFYQLQVAAGYAASGPVPLRLEPDDAWDIRLLGDAIDVGDALVQKETGLSGQLKGKAARLAVNKVLQGLTKAEITTLLRAYPPEQLVVAAMVAQEVGPAATLAFVTEILELRGLAGWEIVAGRWNVARSVLAQIGSLAGQLLTEVRREAPPQSSSSVRSNSGGGSSPRSSGGGGGGNTGGGGNPGTKPKPKPPDNPENPTQPAPPECDLACQAQGTVDGITGV